MDCCPTCGRAGWPRLTDADGNPVAHKVYSTDARRATDEEVDAFRRHLGLGPLTPRRRPTQE